MMSHKHLAFMQDKMSAAASPARHEDTVHPSVRQQTSRLGRIAMRVNPQFNPYTPSMDAFHKDMVTVVDDVQAILVALRGLRSDKSDLLDHDEAAAVQNHLLQSSKHLQADIAALQEVPLRTLVTEQQQMLRCFAFRVSQYCLMACFAADMYANSTTREDLADSCNGMNRLFQDFLGQRVSKESIVPDRPTGFEDEYQLPTKRRVKPMVLSEPPNRFRVHTPLPATASD